MSEQEKPRVMKLDAAVDYIHSHRLILTNDPERGIDLWTPQHPGVPIALRRSVTKYKQELAELMNSGDSRVCVSPELHRPSWEVVGNRMICQHCQRFVTIGVC